MKKFQVTIICILSLMAFNLPIYAQQIKVAKDKNIMYIHRDLLNKDLMFSALVLELSEQKNINAGGGYLDNWIFYFELVENEILVRRYISFDSVVSNSSVRRAVELNNVVPVQFSLPVKDYKNNDFIAVSATEMFKKLQTYNNPLPKGACSGELISAISGIDAVEYKNDTLNVISKYYYKGVRQPFYAKLLFTICKAPERMTPRLEDSRVGYFTIKGGSHIFTDKDLQNANYITKWNIEPKDEDVESYLSGELVVPKKQIRFVIDPATPQYMRHYVELGITDWNKAFEKIGFKDVIIVDSAKGNDLSNELNSNVFRYIPTEDANAQGVKKYDPRTGEIVSGNIYWYHSVPRLLKTWRYIQTAAADPRVRNFDEMPEELVGELIRYATAHEMGHVLGLTHNMFSSSTRTTEELRTIDPVLGTSSSIMDYARCNYVAPINSAKDKVGLTPPILGEYDYFAIEWAYRYHPKNIDIYKKINEFILAHTQNSAVYQFNKGNTRAISDNPLTISNTLGDDMVSSGKYGIENLLYIRKNLLTWNYSLNKDYSTIEYLYTKVVDQYFLYVNSALSMIGGEYAVSAVQGEQAELFAGVRVKHQADAVDFSMKSLLEASDVLYDEGIYSKLGNKEDYIISKQERLMSNMINRNYLSQVDKGMGVDDFLARTSTIIFKDKKVGRYVNHLRATYINKLMILAKPNEKGEIDVFTMYARNELKNLEDLVGDKYSSLIN